MNARLCWHWAYGLSRSSVLPFLVGLWLLMRPMAGYLALLWPGLYALHAILILAGAPIVLTGPWEALNMLIPIAGYGMLAGLASHAYGRFALHRLRRLAQVDRAVNMPADEGAPE